MGVGGRSTARVSRGPRGLGLGLGQSLGAPNAHDAEPFAFKHL